MDGTVTPIEFTPIVHNSIVVEKHHHEIIAWEELWNVEMEQRSLVQKKNLR